MNNPVMLGARVRLVALNGVASDSMRACLGKTGTVTRVRDDTNGRVAVEFELYSKPETFWLKPGEFEVVEAAPLVQPTRYERADEHIERPKKQEASMADFATTIERRIDQLGEEDAALLAQIADLQRQRAPIAQEIASLRAAAAAYERTRAKLGAGPKALPAPRGTPGNLPGGTQDRLRKFIESQGGEVDRRDWLAAEATLGLVSASTASSTLDRYCERVSPGRYRLAHATAP